MDPDIALDSLRRAIRAWQEATVGDSTDAQQDAAADVVAAVTVLDGWLSHGGYLPTAWSPPLPHVAAGDLDAAQATYATAATRLARAIQAKVTARIRRDFPTATSIHTAGEYDEDHDLHLHLVAVNGPTAQLADSASASAVWDELTDEVDPGLDWFGQLEPGDWTGRQELDLGPAESPTSIPHAIPARPTQPEGEQP